MLLNFANGFQLRFAKRVNYEEVAMELQNTTWTVLNGGSRINLIGKLLSRVHCDGRKRGMQLKRNGMEADRVTKRPADYLREFGMATVA